MSGPFGSSQWMYNAGGGFYDFEISNSLRFNSNDTPILNKTYGSAGTSVDTWTVSWWMKLSEGDSQQKVIFGGGGTFVGGSNVATFISMGGSSYDGGVGTGVPKVILQQYAGGEVVNVMAPAFLRDQSAWYHCVVRFDSTQSTDTNRVRIYINGVESPSYTKYDGGTVIYPNQNADSTIGGATEHYIAKGWQANKEFGGYMADFNYCDGQSLAPSSFGEFKNDIWVPKDTSSLTFGDNGFRMQFKQTGTGTASSSTIGADTSGEDNHYTSANLVASDVVLDSPTNNFATLNPLDKNTSATISNGNLTQDASATAWRAVRSTYFVSSGKWYWEATVSGSGSDIGMIGISNSSATLSNIPDANAYGYNGTNGQKYTSSSATAYGASYSNGDVIGIALDMDTGTLTFYKNNTSQGTAYSSLSGLFSPTFWQYAGYTWNVNFGQDSSFAGNKTAQGNADGNGIGDFYYAPPSGFLALCTANLPNPVATIDPAQGGSPQDYFSADIFTGNGTNQDIDIGFVPNLVWTRQRTDASGGLWMDSVRGDDAYFQTTNANAEGNFGNITFTSTGYNVSGNSNLDNEASHNFVGWAWKAGTAFSNDASATGVGNVDSTGSVNADVGFSIIAKTNTGNDNQTVAHGLGVAPDLIIIKNRSTTGSFVIGYNTAGFNWANDYIQFDTGGEKGDGSGTVFGAAPTSTVFTTGSGVNVTNGVTQIAYCFASVDGYSKIGSYTGNGNADGPFIYTGFRPAWIMIKRIDANGNSWRIHDSKRGSNDAINTLHANLTNAEDANNVDDDILSNGYKVRTTSSDQNTNGATYIYMAFAEQPFKYANAR